MSNAAPDREPAPSDSRQPSIWWLAAILALAAALRLYGLADRGLWFDEAAVLTYASFAGSMETAFDPEYINEPPGFPWLVRLWRALGEAASIEPGSAAFDSWLRLLPCLIGVAAAAGVYALGMALLNHREAALIAAFLFAISPFQIYYAQDLRAYSLLVLVNIAALWFFVRVLDKNRIVDWIGLGTSVAAGMYLHFFMVWYIVVYNLIFTLLIPKHWRLLPRWVLCNLAVIAASIPVLRMLIYVNGVFATAAETWYQYPTVWTALITFKNLFAGYSPDAGAYRYLTFGAMAFFGAGLMALRIRSAAFLVLAIVTFAPMLLSVAYWNTQEFPYYTHRLMIACGATAAIGVGYGLAALPAAWLRIPAVAGIALLTLPALRDHYLQRLHPIPEHRSGILYKNETRAAAAYLREHLKEGDIIVHRIRYTYLPLAHYLADTGIEQRVIELDPRGIREATIGYPSVRCYEHVGTMPVLAHEAIAGANRVWLVNSWWDIFGSNPLTEAMPRWFDERGRRFTHRPFDGLDVYGYDLPLGNGLFEQHNILIADRGYNAVVAADTAVSPEGTPLDEEALEADLAARPREFGIRIAKRAGEDMPGHAGIVLQNNSAFARGYSLRAAFSEASLDALAFTPSDPRSSAWRPGPRMTVAEYPHPVGGMALTATLTPRVVGPKTVEQTVFLRAGGYVVEILCAFPSTTEAAAVATVTIEDAGGHVEFRADVPIAGGGPGWRWQELGSAGFSAGPHRILVTAENPANLERAVFSFARVIVRRDSKAVYSAGTLEPGETSELGVGMMGVDARYVDIDLIDEEHEAIRTVRYALP